MPIMPPGRGFFPTNQVESTSTASQQGNRIVWQRGRDTMFGTRSEMTHVPSVAVAGLELPVTLRVLPGPKLGVAFNTREWVHHDALARGLDVELECGAQRLTLGPSTGTDGYAHFQSTPLTAGQLDGDIVLRLRQR